MGRHFCCLRRCCVHSLCNKRCIADIAFVWVLLLKMCTVLCCCIQLSFAVVSTLSCMGIMPIVCLQKPPNLNNLWATACYQFSRDYMTVNFPLFAYVIVINSIELRTACTRVCGRCENCWHFYLIVISGEGLMWWLLFWLLYLLSVCLSVCTVHVIDWKDSSPKRPIMCWWGR